MTNYSKSSGYLYKFKLNLNNDRLLAKCLSVLNDNNLSKITNQKGSDNKIESFQRTSTYPFRLNLDANPHTWEEFELVVDFLQTISNYNSIHDSWVTNSLPGGYIGPHSHKSNKLHNIHSVFIYYVNINDTHCPTRFFIDNKWITLNQKQGDLIYFDNSILHDTLPNEGIGDRIVISGNII